MKRTGIATAVMAVTVFLSTAVVAATQPVSIGTFGKWGAYTYKDDKGQNVCFMSSKPERSEISRKGARRGEIFLFITHWQGDKTKNVVSAAVGYGIGDARKPSIAVDGKSFDVFANGESIWAHDQSVDDALSAALQSGNRAVVKATSSRGTNTTDTYNLSGSAAAYRAITKACGF